MNEIVAIEKIAQWEKLKTLVLDSVSSPITKRVYNMALNEFMTWFQQAPRPGFTKATVSAWRVSLEERRLGSSSIIIRMSAMRKLAAEAADNGLLAPELAQGISRVKSVKSTGIRVGNWLSQKQAQALLSAPDITTVAGLRDRAILAVLLGCGLRRSEVASLTFAHISDLNEVEGAEVDLHIDEHANELGLDLLAYYSFGDSHASLPVLLVQCASGDNWKSKRKTPDLDLWHKIVSFNSHPVRGFAIPFAYAEAKDLRKHSASVNGVFVERNRLLGAFHRTSTKVSAALDAKLSAWVAGVLGAVPKDA